MIRRHSSRRNRLDQSVLTQRLTGAVSYDRIAGYFRSSLFEHERMLVAGVVGLHGSITVQCRLTATLHRKKNRLSIFYLSVDSNA